MSTSNRGATWSGAGHPARSSRCGGFTLVEVSVAMTIFLMIGVAVSHTVKMADGSQDTVREMSEENKGHRKAVSELMDELRTAGAETLEVETDQDGNHILTFQQRIPVGSEVELGWGVDDATLGTQQDWQVRYLVKTEQPAGQAETRRLMRQVLNSEQALEREAEVLASLSQEGPAFLVDSMGSMCQVTLVTEGLAGGRESESVFHVRPRN